MSLYKRGETWWIYLVVNGQRIRRTTGETDRRKAEEIHDQVKHSAKQLKESGRTLNDAIKLWLTEQPRDAREKSAIRVFLKSYPSRSLSDVDGHAILDATKKYSPSHYNRTANIIRACINLAKERGWCQEIKIYRRKEDASRLRFLSKTQWENLKTELQPHVMALAGFAIATGLRQANILNLQWPQVDIDKAMVWVDSPDAKAKKSIGVPLSDYAIEIINAQRKAAKEKATHVFTYNDNPIGSVKTSWNKALIRAKIYTVPTGKVDKNGNEIMRSDFRWHDLRHTWASWHVQNGTPLAVLKELGGWSDINMVMRYAHLSPEHLRQYANNSVA